MELQRKLEIFDQTVALIANGGDDSAVRLAALDECVKRIEATKKRITDASASTVAAALSHLKVSP